MHSKSISISELNERRHQAVRLRLDGKTLAVVSEAVGLSTPTVVAAMKAYQSGGWDAINVKPRGRPKQQPNSNTAEHLAQLNQAFTAAALHKKQLWNTSEVREWLSSDANTNVSEQTTASYLQQWDLVPFNAHRHHRNNNDAIIRTWMDNDHTTFVKDARGQSNTVFWVGERTRPDGSVQMFAHSLRGRCLWQLLAAEPSIAQRIQFLELLKQIQSPSLALVLLPSSNDFVPLVEGLQTCCAPACLEGAASEFIKDTNSVELDDQSSVKSAGGRLHSVQINRGTTLEKRTDDIRLTHLQRLEAESIHIIREVVAEAENPVMLYSMGKDSAVMLQIAHKAFFPGEIPFPLLHVDTTWKFKAMYEFRDRMIKQSNIELLTYVNQEGFDKGVNPFTHGSELHTDIMKTQALKQALDQYGFDVAIGGARRDEEKSRAKERVLSFRSAQHRWDPKNQRPELWSLYNNRIRKGESIRAFPLSNWTELDIWQYIQQQELPVVPLYFAAERPVVKRDGALIMVDDERFPLQEGEKIVHTNVRFRTLGCYPLTGAIESSASSLDDIIQEMLVAKTSERQGRLIDNDTTAAMEKKKQEGYF